MAQNSIRSTTTPSTTHNGSLLPKVVTPLTLTEDEAPGCPEFAAIPVAVDVVPSTRFTCDCKRT